MWTELPLGSLVGNTVTGIELHPLGDHEQGQIFKTELYTAGQVLFHTTEETFYLSWIQDDTSELVFFRPALSKRSFLKEIPDGIDVLSSSEAWGELRGAVLLQMTPWHEHETTLAARYSWRANEHEPRDLFIGSGDFTGDDPMTFYFSDFSEIAVAISPRYLTNEDALTALQATNHAH